MAVLILCFLLILISSLINAQPPPTMRCSYPYAPYDKGLLSDLIIGCFITFLILVSLVILAARRKAHPFLVIFLVFWACGGIAMLVTGAFYTWEARTYADCGTLRWVSAPSPLPTAALDTPTNLTIAFVGDSGATETSINVYQLIQEENAEILVHIGDFDYCDKPNVWQEQIDFVFPSDFPILTVVGNHDAHLWDQYQEVLRNTSYPGLACEGQLGVNYWCVYRGVFFAFSSVGTLCAGYKNYAYHESELLKNIQVATGPQFPSRPWTTCIWHKNQRVYQLGKKDDETGFGVHDICTNSGGAFILTGHDHQYGRTHAILNASTQTIHQTCNPGNSSCVYDLSRPYSPSFVLALVGSGGRGLNSQNSGLVGQPYWGAKYNQDYGALICKYKYNGDPKLVYCYFKDLQGNIQDEFIMSQG